MSTIKFLLSYLAYFPILHVFLGKFPVRRINRSNQENLKVLIRSIDENSGVQICDVPLDTGPAATLNAPEPRASSSDFICV